MSRGVAAAGQGSPPPPPFFSTCSDRLIITYVGFGLRGSGKLLQTIFC